MRAAALDRWAAGGGSWLHRASAPSKWLVLLGAVLLAAVSRSPWPLLAAYLLLALAAASCRLPLRPLLLASLLPAPMVGLFAVSRWDGTFSAPLTIVGKGLVTALAGLLVAATAPYPDLLAPATRALPPVLADSLVMTYRSLFMLAGRVDALWLSIRARGGFFPRPAAGALPWAARGTTLRRRAEVAAAGAALAILRGADLSARLYDVMRLRGYQGRLAPTRPVALGRADWRPLLLSASLAALGVTGRLLTG